MKTIKLNIPFTIVFDSDGNGFSYVNHDLISCSGYFTSESGAKNKLRPQIEKQINNALLLEKNYSEKMIASKNGEVFFINYRHGWEYQIFGPDRKGSGSTLGFQTFDEAVLAARQHVESGFGGVAWES